MKDNLWNKLHFEDLFRNLLNSIFSLYFHPSFVLKFLLWVLSTMSFLTSLRTMPAPTSWSGHSNPTQILFISSVLPYQSRPLTECLWWNVITTRCDDLLASSVENVQLYDLTTAYLPAVKILKDSTVPDGLVLTVIFFVALPRLGTTRDPPHTSFAQRATAIQKCTKEMSKFFAQLQVEDSTQTINGPNVLQVRNVPLDSYVLVYRDRGKSCSTEWTGPFILLHVTKRSAAVLGPSGPQSSRLLWRVIRKTLHRRQNPPILPFSHSSNIHSSSYFESFPFQSFFSFHYIRP